MNASTEWKKITIEALDIVNNKTAWLCEFPLHWEVLRMTDYFSRAIAENKCISFIAKCDGVIAGIGSVQIREQPGNFKNPSGKWGYIMNMYTIPDFRRNGICKGILNELIAEGVKLGITAFELHATKEGESVYKQNGFEIHGEPTFRKFLQNK